VSAATVQSSLARSRAPPGDRKPEQTLCRLRRRDNQDSLTLLELPPILRLPKAPSTVRSSLARSRALPGDRKPEQTLVGCDGATANQPEQWPRRLPRCDHRLRGAGLRPATVSRSRRFVGCDGATISATCRCKHRIARSRAMPGDRKPEQTLCRLRRRDRHPASRSSIFRRSTGSVNVRNGSISACAEPGYARRPQAGADAWSAATARQDIEPACHNRASIACGEPGCARRPQAGADAWSAATARH
jgi:hypothetical protein